MKEPTQPTRRRMRDAVSRATARLRPQHKPTEVEQPSEKPLEPGVIRATTQALKIPENLRALEDRGGSQRASRVFFFIVLLALLFIALIAWLVANEPQT